MSNRTCLFPLKIAASIAIVSFAAAFFILQNLPFTFGDDLNILNIAQRALWSDLIFEFFNIKTVAWYVHGHECQLTTRVFQTLFFKALFFLDGYNTNLFIAAKCLGLAVSSTAIFSIVWHLSRNIPAAICAVLFFAVSLPVYETTAWIADTEIQALAFFLVAAYFLILATEERAVQNLKKIGFFFVFFICAWCAIKLKETARIFPIAALLAIFATMLHKKIFLKTITKTCWTAVALNAILFAAIVPWGLAPKENIQIDEVSKNAFSLNWEGISTFTFTIFEYIAPAVVLLGFYLIYLFFLSKKQKRNDEPAMLGNKSVSLFSLYFVLFWLGGACAGFVLNFKISGNVRYFTTPLAPLSVLIFTVLGLIFFSLSKRLSKEKYFIIVFLAVLASLFRVDFDSNDKISLSFKGDDVVFSRNFHESFDIADFVLTREIYKDFFNKPSADWRELDSFYRDYVERFGQMRRKEWDESVSIQKNELQRCADTYGAAYVMSFKGDLEKQFSYLDRIYEGSTFNKSLFASIFKKLKKKSVRSFFLYKFKP